ncbi:MAG: rhomboid family intramembrane serine protease [Pseudolabrys sp.]|nr:rhomboid family intramembrane serine protease [Pseudolabrys sp.]MBV9956286.1 rhomboid family intramembrane serine protease [Pseudolabrys sp.]
MDSLTRSVQEYQPHHHREPILNVPGVVLATLGLLVGIHVVREYLLSEAQDTDLLLSLAFIPARYDSGLLGGVTLPGGAGAQVWSFFTYALLHGSWMHLVVNSIWLLPFGSALARRFGVLRFAAFMVVTAVAGAVAHLVTHSGEQSIVLGASATVSGLMAGAMRFAFQRGGPLGFWRQTDDLAYRVPALPLSGVWRDPRVFAFIVVWFGLNIVFGLGSFSISGEQAIAWQAHIGGFLAGLLLFGWFDPKPAVPANPY